MNQTIYQIQIDLRIHMIDIQSVSYLVMHLLHTQRAAVTLHYKN